MSCRPVRPLCIEGTIGSGVWWNESVRPSLRMSLLSHPFKKKKDINKEAKDDSRRAAREGRGQILQALAALLAL